MVTLLEAPRVIFLEEASRQLRARALRAAAVNLQAPRVTFQHAEGTSRQRRVLQDAKARAQSTTHALGPAGTEACVGGLEGVLQCIASQSGSRWLRVPGIGGETDTNHDGAPKWLRDRFPQGGDGPPRPHPAANHRR